jgi:VWFA-related protein
MDPRANQTVKAIGRYVVDHLGPDDLATIVFTADNRNALDFTSDRGRLHAMLQKFHGGGGQMGWLFARYSTGVLRSLTETLRDVRDRRKMIIYVSTGVPGATNSAGSDPELYYRTQDAIREARLANIAFYPINPAGLEGLDLNAVGAAIRGEVEPDLPPVMQATPSANQRVSPQDAMNQAWDALNARSDHLDVLASNTGGFVVGDSNSFVEGVAQVFRENSSYYLLGFRPSALPDGKRRRLEVRVDYPSAPGRPTTPARTDARLRR